MNGETKQGQRKQAGPMLTTADGLNVEEARGILRGYHEQLLLKLAQEVAWKREAFDVADKSGEADRLLEAYVCRLNVVCNALGHFPNPPEPPVFEKKKAEKPAQGSGAPRDGA